jgi:single-stranded DNA-binding protein
MKMQMQASVDTIVTLGTVPVIKNLNGRSVARFSVGIFQRINPNTPENASDKPKLKMKWFDVVAWGPTAERMHNAGKKGDKLRLVGDLVLKNWVDKNGKQRNKLELSAKAIFPVTHAKVGVLPVAA